MTNSTLVLGADGGGTKTLGLLADSHGAILARAQAGGSNQNVVGTHAAATTIAELILRCCREAGRKPAEIGAAVVGLAGAGADHQRQELIAAVHALMATDQAPPVPITIESDARVALEGAFAGGPGVVVIAGTGSVVIAKTAAGALLQVGGWGRVLGDEGSGYFLGLQALTVITQELDGRGEAGALREMIATRFGLATRERIIAAVYRDRFEIPSLAPLVLEAAAAGDGVAFGILHTAAALLANQVEATVRQLGLRDVTGVVFSGGLIDHETVYSRLLHEEIVTRCPNTDVRPPLHGPAHGAVLMAQARLKGS